MTSINIELLLLSVNDKVEFTFENLFYKLTKYKEITSVELEFNKQGEEGWIPCPKLVGDYCGDNYKQNPYELNVIKIRVSEPFNMGSDIRNYLTFAPSQVLSIKIIGKTKLDALDLWGILW